jgi:hypothetical protein
VLRKSDAKASTIRIAGQCGWRSGAPPAFLIVSLVRTREEKCGGPPRAFGTVPPNSRGGNNSRQKQWTVLISIISVPRKRQDEEETVAGVGRPGRRVGGGETRDARMGGEEEEEEA